MKKKVGQIAQSNGAMSGKDIVLWILLFVLLAFAFVFNYTYSQYSLPIRLLAWFCVCGVAVALAAATQKGKDFYSFIQLAYVELVKVVWPSREEVVRMALLVAVMVVIASIMLWLIDSTFLWMMRHI